MPNNPEHKPYQVMELAITRISDAVNAACEDVGDTATGVAVKCAFFAKMNTLFAAIEDATKIVYEQEWIDRHQ